MMMKKAAYTLLMLSFDNQHIMSVVVSGWTFCSPFPRRHPVTPSFQQHGSFHSTQQKRKVTSIRILYQSLPPISYHTENSSGDTDGSMTKDSNHDDNHPQTIKNAGDMYSRGEDTLDLKYGTKKQKGNRFSQIQFVPWAGCKGLLPLQYYKNAMEYADYESWLLRPFPAASNNDNDNDETKNDYAKMHETTSNTPPETKPKGYQQHHQQTNSSNSETRNTKTIKAEAKANQPLQPTKHLLPIYVDSHIIAVDKPSGVLCVPGSRRNPSIANLVYDYFGNEEQDVDCMVVHRLDMDTSGVVVFARSKHVLSILHDAFRNKSQMAVSTTTAGYDFDGSDEEEVGGEVAAAATNASTQTIISTTMASSTVSKKYEALVCGHMTVSEGEIYLPLTRDWNHPPFMRVSHHSAPEECLELDYFVTHVIHGDSGIIDGNGPISNVSKKSGGDDNRKDDGEPANRQQWLLQEKWIRKRHRSHVKMMSTPPKESLTCFRVLSWEYLDGLPVTRLELIPVTGRTHQLRVHCAAIGHPILGDNLYGFDGEGSPNGGFSDECMDQLYPHRASMDLQRQLYDLVCERRTKKRRRKRRRRRKLDDEGTVIPGTGNDSWEEEEEEKDDMETINGGMYNGSLCLHAKELRILHPITCAPIIFEADAPF